MQYLESLKFINYFGNSVYDYSVALGVFIGLLVILKIVKAVIVSKLKKISEKTKNDFDDTVIDIFSRVRPPFYFLISLYFSLTFLSVSQTASNVIKILFLMAVVYEVVRGLERLIDYFVSKYLKGIEGEDEIQSRAMVRSVNVLIKIALWILAITLILSNMGINVTSIIASLGIGGIAIALALQNILGDMFSSFSIYVDKPFKVGDFIVIGKHSGTVERIGLRSTRIRTLQGQELIMANKELVTARIENYKRMEERRVVVELGVLYETSEDKLERIPGITKNIVEEVNDAEFDRCHFKAYGDFALVFELVYFVESADYNAYMDINQEVNLKIFKAFAREKIEFAYPTQTVYLNK